MGGTLLFANNKACSCGALKDLTNLQIFERVFQFFIDLSDQFQHTRSQILAIDPLSTISKCFTILHQETHCLLQTHDITHWMVQYCKFNVSIFHDLSAALLMLHCFPPLLCELFCFCHL